MLEDYAELTRKNVGIAYTSTYKACSHSSGWYFTVPFFIWEKRLYWCDICHDWFDSKFIDNLFKESKIISKLETK